MIRLVLMLRGGGQPRLLTNAELKIARGGQIKQAIHEDMYPCTLWHAAHTMAFNVQLLNSHVFEYVTGDAPPKTPVTVETYAQAGYPFFSIYEESSDVHGNFSKVKSVAELDGKTDAIVKPHVVQLAASGRRATQEYEELKKIVEDESGLLDPAGPLTTFRTVEDLRKEVKEMSIAKIG